MKRWQMILISLAVVLILGICWGVTKLLPFITSAATALSSVPAAPSPTSTPSSPEPINPANAARLVTTAVLTGPAPSIYNVAFSPDSQALAAASGQEEVWLWDVVTGQSRAPVLWPGTEVADVAFSPDGQTLALIRGDGAVGLWDMTASIFGWPTEPVWATNFHLTHLAFSASSLYHVGNDVLEGNITLRVPSERYQVALAGLRALAAGRTGRDQQPGRDRRVCRPGSEAGQLESRRGVPGAAAGPAAADGQDQRYYRSTAEAV